MKNIFGIWALCLMELTLLGQEFQQLDLPERVQNRIDSLFLVYSGVSSPGYCIGISKHEQTLFQKGYGSANLDYNIPLTTRSAFSIASVSKQFTAACIALLVLEGKVSLDDPASNYIPELEKYAETILIKHLIYNTSGILDYPRIERSDGKSWITFNYFDIDECIATSLSQELQFRPGDRWDYCNVNFMLLTKIVEKVSGLAFSEFAKRKLFAPLGMNETIINDDITQVIPNRVTPYNLRTKENVQGYRDNGVQVKLEGGYIQHTRNSPHYGGSGVVTTIEDLLRWCKNMYTKQFGGQPFYDLMHKTIKFKHDRDNQAFGLYIGDFNGREIVAWDGGDWGISSQMMRFPKEGVAIIVLSNIGSGESYKRVNEIADILIAEDILK